MRDKPVTPLDGHPSFSGKWLSVSLMSTTKLKRNSSGVSFVIDIRFRNTFLRKRLKRFVRRSNNGALSTVDQSVSLEGIVKV